MRSTPVKCRDVSTKRESRCIISRKVSTAACKCRSTVSKSSHVNRPRSPIMRSSALRLRIGDGGGSQVLAIDATPVVSDQQLEHEIRSHLQRLRDTMHRNSTIISIIEANYGGWVQVRERLSKKNASHFERERFFTRERFASDRSVARHRVYGCNFLLFFFRRETDHHTDKRALRGIRSDGFISRRMNEFTSYRHVDTAPKFYRVIPALALAVISSIENANSIFTRHERSTRKIPTSYRCAIT